MKRPQDMNARMRPFPNDDGPDPETAAPEDLHLPRAIASSHPRFAKGQPEPASSRASQSHPVSRPRRQIWEMEEDARAEAGYGRTPTSQGRIHKDPQSEPRPISHPQAPRRVTSGQPQSDPLVLRNPIAPPGQPRYATPAPAPEPRRYTPEPEPRYAQQGGADPRAPISHNPAKTRILGFSSDLAQADALDAVAESHRASLRFPAGWLVVTDGPGLGAFFAVTTSVSNIGRGADQDICLDFGDTSISRQNHAAVAYDIEQNRFFLGHGNKSNVVRRNDQPVLATEELQDGDLIRIGKTTLRFKALCGEDFTWSPEALAAAEGGYYG